MKKTILTACSLFALLVAAPASTLAEEVNVEEVVNKANLAAYYAGDDGRAEVNMTITDSQGRERNREFVILRKDVEDGGKQLFYVYFKKPSDVKKMVFMVHKNVTSDDDRWMYLPALDLVKRIAASDKRTSFVGSNFMYEDVSGRNLSEDTRELVESNDSHYLIKNTPKKPMMWSFPPILSRSTRKTFCPSRRSIWTRTARNTALSRPPRWRMSTVSPRSLSPRLRIWPQAAPPCPSSVRSSIISA
jgi:hypothetical protein